MENPVILGRTLTEWKGSFPVLEKVVAKEECFWWNQGYEPFDCWKKSATFSQKDVAEAEARLQRFAPLLERLFPELEESRGIIESPLREIPRMASRGEALYGRTLEGKFFLKMDSHLPISGSIKARGGIYEVLKHAEDLALREGFLSQEDSYALLGEPEARSFFSKHALAVGSTGNLGLSIGIMGAALGFQVFVHMSADAKQWKKDLLRSRGAQVIEYEGDYGKAVEEGRRQAQHDPRMHFVDDESSKDLFLGYATAAGRLQKQLQELNIPVDSEHPLFVYLPCGVGGAPGGITLGLKFLFGDAVHCFFAEPTHAPCALLGILTGLYDRVGVEDFGLDNRTDADGLAVGRISGLVGGAVGSLVSGGLTVSDAALYRLLALLKDTEDLFLEPSALAGVPGPYLLKDAPGWNFYEESYLPKGALERGTHVAWATGGNMVPGEMQAEYYQRGQALL